MELLSCPFCGGYADDTITKQTRCGNSGCIMSKFWYDVEFWNTRTLPDEVEQALEAADEMSAWVENLELEIGSPLDKSLRKVQSLLAACQHLWNKGE